MTQVTNGLLPRLTATDPASIKTWADQICGQLESTFQQLNAPVGSKGWAATDVTPSRTIDGGTATLVQTSQTLATLIQDLLAGGIVTLK